MPPALSVNSSSALGVERHRVEVAEERPVQAETTSSAERDDVEVGRDGEDRARLLQAPQVGQRHEDDETEAERDPVVGAGRGTPAAR